MLYFNIRQLWASLQAACALTKVPFLLARHPIMTPGNVTVANVSSSEERQFGIKSRGLHPEF